MISESKAFNVADFGEERTRRSRKNASAQVKFIKNRRGNCKPSNINWS